MIRVRIPATTANLGPGFDCLGLALNLWNSFEMRLDGAPNTIDVITEGEGSTTLPHDRSHLVVSTMIDETWPGMMPTDCGIAIRCENQIPAASGLGSSSTATLAGLIFASALAARALHPNDPVAVLAAVRDKSNLERVLHRAIKLEGHGDNVAPALLGGLILVVHDEGDIVKSVDFRPFTVVVCVPEYNFLTSEARAALPPSYSRSDAIHNVGHALLVVEALRTADWGLLRRAMGDRIHEPYRLPLIPGASEAKAAALRAGAIAATLSGAGPGILAIAESGHEEIGQAMVEEFATQGLKSRFWKLKAIDHGAQIEAI